MDKKSLLLVALLLVLPALARAEATISEVYQAAESGQLERAQQMMKQVLAVHPKSAKAHFVEAELLLRQGRREEARQEYLAARQLDPALAFAKPASVSTLQAALGLESVSSTRAADDRLVVQNTDHSWLWLVIAITAVLVLLQWFKRQRQSTVVQGGVNGMGYPPSPAGSYPPAYPPNAGGPGLMGSLATGAAIGAGLVAGEALAHRLLGSDHPAAGRESDLLPSDSPPSRNDDMGGDNFGISDDSSWDSGDSSGGGDW